MHRTAVVDNEVATQIGFLFVALSVKFIGFGKEFPVDVLVLSP